MRNVEVAAEIPEFSDALKVGQGIARLLVKLSVQQAVETHGVFGAMREGRRVG